MEPLEEMSEEDLREAVEETLDGEWIDATGRIDNYKHGKTLECDCGQGIGVEYGTLYIGCATCKTTLVDFKAGEREPPKRDSGQSALGQFT